MLRVRKSCNMRKIPTPARNTYAVWADQAPRPQQWGHFFMADSVARGRRCRMTNEQKCKRYLEKRIEIDATTGCWVWQKALVAGRGQVGRATLAFRLFKTRSVHRISYALHKGVPLSDDLIIRHRCRNEACINPDHLEERARSDTIPGLAAIHEMATPGLYNLRSKVEARLAMIVAELLRRETDGSK